MRGQAAMATCGGFVLLAVSLAGCHHGPGYVTRDGAWRLVRSSPASSSVLINYYHGDCDSLPGVSVTSRPAAVRIILHERDRTGVCDDRGVLTTLRIRLVAPLGTRRIEGGCSLSANQLCRGLISARSSKGPFRTFGP